MSPVAAGREAGTFSRQPPSNTTSMCGMVRVPCCSGLFIVAAAGVTSSYVLGCQPAEVKECRERYLVTHAMVAAVDPGKLSSVEPALQAVESNLEVCQKANLTEESKQLTTAKRKLESHQAYLEVQQAQRDLSPTELEALEKNGDPQCPKGQTYQYKKAGKRIRCTGPQIVNMNVDEAKTYFSNRGFKVSENDKGLRAELGSESYTFEYPAGERAAPPQCLVVFSQPGIAWQESVARLTGAMPSRLKEGTPVRVGKLEIPFELEHDPVQAILRFGHCASSNTAKSGETP